MLWSFLALSFVEMEFPLRSKGVEFHAVRLPTDLIAKYLLYELPALLNNDLTAAKTDGWILRDLRLA